MGIIVTSNSFQDGGRIPDKCTYVGDNVSPQLAWEGVPKGTKSLAIICDDPDAPVGNWVHWVAYGLSPDISDIPEGVPAQETLTGQAKQGASSFGSFGYGGPCPPPGPAHRYFFNLYALDNKIDLASGATAADLRDAMEGHIISEGHLIGMYGG